MTHQVIFNYRFHEVTKNECWTIIVNNVSSIFLVNGCHIQLYGKVTLLNYLLNIMDNEVTKNECWMIIVDNVSSPFLVNGCHIQLCGKVTLLNYLLNIMDNGIALNSPTGFIIEIGQPFGPGDLLLCIFIILSKTISGVKSIDSDMGVEPVGSIAGIEVVSSL